MAANAERTMIPLHSLLNPVPPKRKIIQSHHVSPTTIPTSASSATTWIAPSRAKMDRLATQSRGGGGGIGIGNTSGLVKSKTQGLIRFAPFENVDEKSYRELSRFQVDLFGQIHEYCEHIPYNSSKKDFFEKTGRESIEVFKYEFRLPDDDNCYTVMWDYNVGLVRMTPFFKCLGFAKTKPSQMLDKNPGLRDICPSVTGGAVTAQGYWMPYRCAKAICATFCYSIAGALIPIFGPAFPSECTPPSSVHYKEMIISQQIVIEATKEAEYFRRVHSKKIPSTTNTVTANRTRLQLRSKQETGDAPIAKLQQLPFTCWKPVNAVAKVPQPFANSTPRRGYELHEYKIAPLQGSSSMFMSRHYLDSDPFQHINPFLKAIPRLNASEPPRALVSNWKLKRRRHVNPLLEETKNENMVKQACSEDPRFPTNNNNNNTRTTQPKRPGQELDQFRAAAALVSLQKDTLGLDWQPGVIGDSDSEGFPGGIAEPSHHRKKRPKANSF